MANLDSTLHLTVSFLDENGLLISEPDTDEKVLVFDRWARDGQERRISMEEAKHRVFSGGIRLWEDNNNLTDAVRRLLLAAESRNYTVDQLNAICEDARFVEVARGA